MNNPQARAANGEVTEHRATVAHPIIGWTVLTGAAAPPGQRILRCDTAYAIHLFPMTVRDAQQLGRALSAPGVIAAG